MKNIIHILITGIVFLLATFKVSAQFTITDDFKGSGSPDVILGDEAYLTSGVSDPVNAGWLRLTEASESQKGYAYVNKSFPSTLGVLVDFEFTMWRDQDDNTYNGADGFSVFLFDANYGPGNFALGAYGSSLGYANNTATNPRTPGLTGGYVGIGFDAYGNYVRNSEGKNGGSSQLSPNSVALRGPTTSANPDDPNTNKYLDGVTILGNGNIVDALNEQGNAQDDVVDYNTTVGSRPSYANFYRRIQVQITPTGNSTYNITVRWATTQGDVFTELINYTTSDIPPELLKLGFAASTGGGFNYHEIRNLLVTTPGNLRVNKLADKNVLRSVAGSGNENEITYIIEVTNDTPAAISTINIEDQLTDGEGNPIPNGMLNITDISHSGFTNANLPTPTSGAPITSGNFNGTVGLPANSTGTITVKAILNEIPTGNLLQNTVNIGNNEVTDPDLANNTSTVNTPVIAEGVDLTIKKDADQQCLDATNGNDFIIRVSNLGTEDLNYSSTNDVVVTDEIPAGATLTNNSTGWTHSSNGNIHTFTLNGTGTLGSGRSAPPIMFTIDGVSSGYTNTAQVEFNGSGSNIEPPENLGNNSSSINIASQPNAPNVPEAGYIEVCQGETILTSNITDPGYTLTWYLNEGGSPIIPDTSTPGYNTYYLSQSEGGCESELIEILVLVKDASLPESMGGCDTGWCLEDVEGESFSLSDGESVTFNQPATNYGFQFDIYTLDNSFNLEINGTKLAVKELEFQSLNTSGINVRFADGDEFETDTEGDIWQMTGSASAPLIRVVIGPTGSVALYASKVSGGPLFPLVLINDNEFNNIPWNSTGTNTIVGTQNVVGATTMTGYGSGKNKTPCLIITNPMLPSKARN
ncbi:lectin-like domain-containing protein [Salegentibacter maritimus]|uniref:DUF11 domain-containing protein n=1 Tax=Salegentibacter maritimus TaxID=2794347 RepID=A0ABS0TK03_9FLAO|nr:DUF11 domain-containing protein [Salegentibacter maritimus]MBI6121358.1 hypothetical protein [Salegentibacter maritimus]